MYPTKGHRQRCNNKQGNWLKINPQSSNKIKQEVSYFIAGPDKEAVILASTKMLWELHNKCSDVFTGT